LQGCVLLFSLELGVGRGEILVLSRVVPHSNSSPIDFPFVSFFLFMQVVTSLWLGVVSLSPLSLQVTDAIIYLNLVINIIIIIIITYNHHPVRVWSPPFAVPSSPL